MSVEYLLVVYDGDRDVLANGDRVGVTNHTILLATDEYIVTLSGDGTPMRGATPRTPIATNTMCTCSMADWSTIRVFSH
jgi:hypothetical protein